MAGTTKLIAMRFNKADRSALKELAGIMQRSQSDTVRTLVRETLQAFKAQQADAPAGGQADQSQTREVQP